MGKKKEKASNSSACRAATTATIEVDSTYYNLTSTSTHPRSHSEGQSRTSSQGHQTPVRPVAQSVDTTQSSSSSSSSSSATSSNSEAGGPHLSMVPRPPLHPAMMGLPVHPYLPGPYGMLPAGYGPQAVPFGGMMGQMMPYSSQPYPPPGPAVGGAGPGVGMGLSRHFPHEEHEVDDRIQALKNPMIMEHPSLRQFVILMAIVFLLSFVALIVTAIYFGRTLDYNWKV